MQLQLEDAYFSRSRSAIDNVLYTSQLFFKIKRKFGYATAVVFSLPLSLYVTLFVHLGSFFLRRYVHKVKLNLKNYKTLKNHQTELNKVAKKMEEIDMLDFRRNAPYTFFPVIRSFDRFQSFFNEYSQQIKLKLETLDDKQKGIFENVTENDLWEKRAKSYEYIL